MSSAGASRDPGLFGPDSVSWKVNRETTVLFGGARALLMQAAHPLLLAGARQTGFYETNAWKRLERTLQLNYAITFGTEAEAREAARRINEVHSRIKGVDEVTGLPYDATDPELLLWVHACLVDSALLFEELTVGELDDEGREAFHREQMVGVGMLGLPASRIPATVPELRAYIDEMVSGDILTVTSETMKIADLAHNPPPDVPWRPVLRLLSRWAFGTLPEPLRDRYCVRWSAAKEIQLRASLRALKLVRPVLPGTIREILPARQAALRTGASV